MTFKVGDRVRLVCNFAKGTLGTVVGQPTEASPRTHNYKEYYYVQRDPAGPTDCLRYHESELELAMEPKPHKWAKEIIAWANGAEIEVRYLQTGDWCGWMPATAPQWNTVTTVEYRIKPEKKPDRIETRFLAYDTKDEFVFPKDGVKPNVKFTFDGDTGKLKAVELIN